ncbi:hypothetical protein [Streptomyces sp. NPDC048277]|uniref:hypothetical protein n=1 Tax=Streptomyces sp. NPDC048277 TaxID=3155027 RepID=UPI0033DDED26
MATEQVSPATSPGLRPATSPVRVAAIAAALLVSGCSANLGSGGAEVQVTPPVTGYGGLLGLPLSSYGTSEQDDGVLFQARKALVVRCVKARGDTSYSGQNMNRVVAKTEKEREAVHPFGAWGYIGRATAKRFGFHPGMTLPTGKSPTGKTTKDFKACLGKADQQLPSPTGTEGWKLSQDLFAQSLQQAGRDSRVGAARKRWSACMTRAGHPAVDPEKLASGPWKTAKPTGEETAAATSAESKAPNDYQKQVRKLTGQAAQLLTVSPTT